MHVLFSNCAPNTCVGLNISEVSHDIQAQVSEYVSTDLGLVNSYDTWHGEGVRCKIFPCLSF